MLSGLNASKIWSRLPQNDGGRHKALQQQSACDQPINVRYLLVQTHLVEMLGIKPRCVFSPSFTSDEFPSLGVFLEECIDEVPRTIRHS